MLSFAYKILSFHNSRDDFRFKLKKNDSKNFKYNLMNIGKLIKPASKTAKSEKTFVFVLYKAN